jgi:hypothetical protein
MPDQCPHSDGPGATFTVEAGESTTYAYVGPPGQEVESLLRLQQNPGHWAPANRRGRPKRELIRRLARATGDLGSRWQDEAIAGILTGRPAPAHLAMLEGSHVLLGIAARLERVAFPRRKVTP